MRSERVWVWTAVVVLATGCAEGHELRIGPLAATRMMCSPGSMDAAFAQGLGGARSWFMQADTLRLELMADSGTMRFVR